MRMLTYFRAYVRCRNILSDIDRRHSRSYSRMAAALAMRRWQRYARLAIKLEQRLEAVLDEREEA